MKLIVKLAAAACFLLIIACGGKKENDDAFGKPVVEGTEAEAANSDTPPAENTAKNESGKTGADLGKEVFEGKGTCVNCHKADTKTVGPSLKDISKIYKEKNASIVNFLLEKGEAIVDPSQYAVMKVNFGITKNMSEEELKGIEEYILSH